SSGPGRGRGPAPARRRPGGPAPTTPRPTGRPGPPRPPGTGPGPRSSGGRSPGRSRSGTPRPRRRTAAAPRPARASPPPPPDPRPGGQARHQQDQVDLLLEPDDHQADPGQDVDAPLAGPEHPLRRPEEGQGRARGPADDPSWLPRTAPRLVAHVPRAPDPSR